MASIVLLVYPDENVKGDYNVAECAVHVEEMTDPRFKARIAFFNGPSHKQLISNYSVNMSTGGVFMETENILPVGTILLVKFKLPDNDTIIACNVRVTWANEPGNLNKSQLPPGMGLQFLNLSLENMYAIRDYLNKGNLVPTW